jgi:four helix bundle protein
MDSGNLKKEKTIKSFSDLRAYQNLYQAMIIVLTKIIPYLPKEERYDLVDQMRRCCKAAPALMAEGFAKRYQKINWQRYINDAIGEANEMIHHLNVCLDIYSKYVDINMVKKTIDLYDLSCRQLTNLKKSWRNYHQLH